MKGSAILSNKPLPTSGPYPTSDPYLFCVYHKDQYPQGNGKMEAPFPGNGHDFNPSNPYRMYHGDLIPGFPQHPHRGFETITATIDGVIDHADSAGNCGRYGMGDLQWMTAGEGIVHSEMFPLLKTDEENPLRFFQIWLNLPAKSKMVKPSFVMFWANDVPEFRSEDDKATATVWVGSNYWGIKKNNSPPPDSWASDETNDVALVHIKIHPGGKIILPKAHESSVNRSLFYIEGSSGMLVDGQAINDKVFLSLDPTKDVTLQLPDEHKTAGEFLWLQGKPIDEPVASYGPFVMNTQQEIRQAFSDYRETEFGGWPWPRDDMVFPMEKGRFALHEGKETEPIKSERERSEL
eukprot:CAMPEP_0178896178 /NCGR_PEP_ID=MMETSP0786-20121207/1013_1 /TAXON_ID=186022 /ORGANISM="Thalassionema frauenfeldii, Strain CCMP 1798" /LENGTH=349 /DNA_ID=CAMNT_0020566521 /DNA_START=41 /DNA_END=1090 /DNA_ORIENTATION=-